MDRLETARRLIIAGLLFSFFVLLAVLADATIRSGYSDRRSDMRFRAAYLSGPAIFPSGHPLRNPQGMHAGVDLRFAPGLPLHLKDPFQTAAPSTGTSDGVYPP